MIPDKIYIQEQDGKTITLNKVYDTDIEYVRKDALLELIQKCLRSVDYGDWYELGLTDAFSEIIDKINSM